MPSTGEFLSGTAQAVRQMHRVFYALARRLGPMPSTGEFLSGTAQAVRQIHRVFYATGPDGSRRSAKKVGGIDVPTEKQAGVHSDADYSPKRTRAASRHTIPPISNAFSTMVLTKYPSTR
ncbi:hypothetical protein FF011L_19800 [Roseimaritima multifibrata]|uniref:Uncharacterized protein n=1 Tax=Roseimaritima multifibrata TaxID=1930274 RepID=A0A517MEA7_9BACT|nr:hypothetical protein FF011L_19800 [Roseimaritima multifibrata]